MGTRIEDTSGTLLWAPNDFGKYSLDKMQSVADILSNILTEMTITVKSDSESLKNTYTKEEILDILKTYMLKADFEEMAGQAVRDKTDIYIKDLQDAGKIVTTDTTDSLGNELSDLKRIANYLTKICFDSTYASAVGWQEEPFIQVLPVRLDNVDSQIIDISSKVDGLVRDVYVDFHERQGFKFATTDQLEDVSNKIDQVSSGDLSTLESRVTSLEQSDAERDTEIQKLEQDVSDITSSIGDMSSIDSSVTGSSLIDTINNLVTVVNGLSSRIQSLEDRITQLETNP